MRSSELARAVYASTDTLFDILSSKKSRIGRVIRPLDFHVRSDLP